MMDFVTKAFFWGYVAMLIGVGGSGIFIARWELGHFFAVPLERLAPTARATLLNQYRFLKALELGFGGYGLIFYRQIFELPIPHRFFVLVLSAGVGARLLSLRVDGRASNYFIAVTVLEIVTGILVVSSGPSLF